MKSSNQVGCSSWQDLQTDAVSKSDYQIEKPESAKAH